MSPVPIAFADMDAYARLHRIEFSSWELGTIQALEGVWFVDYGERMKANKEASGASR
jgi:hypothetical protein